MAETSVLKPRKAGRNAVRALRREGLIPGIIYGKSIEPVPVALDVQTFRRFTGGAGSHVHHVKVEGTKFEGDVMVQEVVREPMTGKALHIDLHKISMTEKVKTEVPVTVAGEESLEKNGLILQRQLREITVECLPGDIPDSVTVDVSALQLGESITAGELPLPGNVKLVTDGSEVVVVAVSPKITEEKAEEAAEGEESPEAEKPEGSAN